MSKALSEARLILFSGFDYPAAHYIGTFVKNSRLTGRDTEHLALEFHADSAVLVEQTRFGSSVFVPYAHSYFLAGRP